MKPLEELGSSSEEGKSTTLGCTSPVKSGLGSELTWYVSQILNLGGQGTDRLRIVFGKWIKRKSRGFDHLSYRARIRNKSSFYSKDDIKAPSFLILMG